MSVDQSFPLIFLSVPSIALFSFLAVAAWSDARRREREAYYRSETIKKIAESAGSSSVVEFLRDEEKTSARKRLEGQKLGGLITIAIGIALMIFIKAVNHEDQEPAYLVGLIPLLVGVALLAYAYLLAPKE